MKKLFIIIMLFFSVRAYAIEPTAIWVEAQGSAVAGEAETGIEAKARARKDAERNAIEQAVGTFVKSHSVVANYQLAEDLTYASVRGRIEKVEVVREWRDEQDKDIYRVMVKALVQPVYPEKGEGFSIKLALSKPVLNEGDEVRIFYQADKDAYVYIFVIAADGSVTLLFPNSLNRDNLVKPGVAYQFPLTDSGVSLKAAFLPGFKGDSAEETVKVMATRKKEEIISLGFKEGMFEVYDAKSTGMISDLIRRLGTLEPADWTEASAVYTIKRAGGR
ncbi:MAG: flagellar assembly protein T N-terminal domain-containing protein [Deltaproteobacteria bacterium]|nr:flagellar assembly protein T N-terminal domain-containing protein [Deltaproteobacteria bacterium]MBI5886257.1 flagellar assembly protein T N-terminal domain-containing protein [Deltaproteobacteria bacterium]